jgi:predicted dienelactone hydrolase
MSRLLFFFLSFVVPLAAAAPLPDYTQVAGPFAVGALEQTWHDAKRNRDVPVKIYYPTGPGAPATSPVIVFSHGLGGSREGYRYLGECWASHGFISVHVQHPGSDSALLRNPHPLRAAGEAIHDLSNAINRPLDISFAIDRLTALDVDASFPLRHRLDLSHLGVAGHSFGAYTTMAVAGAQNPALGPGPKYLDPRIKAAIAMSTPASASRSTDTAFAAVKIPVFHMTGTKDQSPGFFSGRAHDSAIVGQTAAADRRLPFDHTRQAVAYLLTFAGGDHMVFSGRLATPRPNDREFQALVCTGSTAFWEAYLRNDAAALKWLETGGFATSVGALGVFEQKHPS